MPQQNVYDYKYLNNAKIKIAKDNNPITIAKIARPIPCRFLSARMWKIAQIPKPIAKGAGNSKTENKPR